MHSTDIATADTYQQQLNYNKPTLLNNIGNTVKRVFRYTIHIIKKVFNYVKSIFSNQQYVNKDIKERFAVRIDSAKDLGGKNWLMLGNNKDIRLHRSNIQEMLKMHLKPNTFVLYVDENNNINRAYGESASEVISNYEPSTVALPNADDNTQLINNMIAKIFMCILNDQQNNFDTTKKIQIIIELPSIIKSPQDLKTYYHSCNQWMINFNLQISKKTLFLPFVKQANNFKRIVANFSKQQNNQQNNSTNKDIEQDHVTFTNLSVVEQNIHNNDFIDEANLQLSYFNKSQITTEMEQHYSDIANLVGGIDYIDYRICIKTREPERPNIEPIGIGRTRAGPKNLFMIYIKI